MSNCIQRVQKENSSLPNVIEMESNIFNRLVLWARPDKLKINQGKFKVLHIVKEIKDKGTSRQGECEENSSIYDMR